MLASSGSPCTVMRIRLAVWVSTRKSLLIFAFICPVSSAPNTWAVGAGLGVVTSVICRSIGVVAWRSARWSCNTGFPDVQVKVPLCVLRKLAPRLISPFSLGRMVTFWRITGMLWLGSSSSSCCIFPLEVMGLLESAVPMVVLWGSIFNFRSVAHLSEMTAQDCIEFPESSSILTSCFSLVTGCWIRPVQARVSLCGCCSWLRVCWGFVAVRLSLSTGCRCENLSDVQRGSKWIQFVLELLTG